MSRIMNVRFITNEYKYIKPFHIANSITASAKNVEVEVITEDGFKGIGEASPSFRVCGETIDSVMSFSYKITELIKGVDVKHYKKIFELTDKFIASPSLRASVQFACLDAMCKEIGIGVWEFFGGANDSIETDKTVSIGSIKERVDDAVKIKRDGFKVIKIKVGENIHEDIEALCEIYKKTKGVRYIVDANMGYNPKEAVYFAKKVYSMGIDIDLFEQPVDRYDIEGLKYVRFKSPFPVCADESAKTRYDVLNLIKLDAVDFINIKLMKSGISDALSIIELCIASRKNLMIGCMGESSVGINQSVQLACGSGVFKYCDLDSHLMLNEKKYRGDFIQKGCKMLVD